MLFIIGLAAVLTIIIVFCMAMEKRDHSQYRSTSAKTVIYTQNKSNDSWDPLDPADPYNDCPDCGSGDTDGNHCYDCDEDF